MAGISRSNFKRLADAVWTLVALASRTVNVDNWRGVQPNALLSGRVDANAQVVGDKTGYSLTAGSYSVIKSIQQGSTTITEGNTSNTTTITSVNTAKAFIIVRNFGDGSGGTNGGDVILTNGTTVTYNRSTSSGTSTAHWTVVEFF